MPLKLVDTNIFAELRKQWSAQCEEAGEEIENFAVVSMDHATKIISEGSGNQDYNIYSASREGHYECILHVNKARLPKSEGITQRVMWVLFEPHRDCRRPIYLSYAAMGILSMAA